MPTPRSILVDLNVILDVLLERPGYPKSSQVLELGEGGGCTLFVSAHAVTTLVYLLEHAKVPRPNAQAHVRWLLDVFKVVGIDHALLRTALNSGLKDYEDAVVEGAAVACGARKIVTRNIKDFKGSLVAAVTPSQLLAEGV